MLCRREDVSFRIFVFTCWKAYITTVLVNVIQEIPIRNTAEMR